MNPSRLFISIDPLPAQDRFHSPVRSLFTAALGMVSEFEQHRAKGADPKATEPKSFLTPSDRMLQSLPYLRRACDHMILDLIDRSGRVLTEIPKPPEGTPRDWSLVEANFVDLMRGQLDHPDAPRAFVMIRTNRALHGVEKDLRANESCAKVSAGILHALEPVISLLLPDPEPVELRQQYASLPWPTPRPLHVIEPLTPSAAHPVICIRSSNEQLP